MLKLFLAYSTTIVIMFSLDLVWLNGIAKPIYQQGIGHLMAAIPNLWAAASFYLIYAAGLMWFALIPNGAKKGLKGTFQSAAIFGFFVYASYDLTNLALLKDWPLTLSLIDIAWGTLLSPLAASCGKWVLDRCSHA